MIPEFNTLLEEAGKEQAYQNYLQVREAVFQMIAHAPKAGESLPSVYWSEELSGMDYMLDASPLIIKKLRHHCYHLTGARDYDYRPHHAHKASLLESKLETLRALESKGLFVAESPELGGFGYNIGGKLVNADTLRFYESLITLEKSGFLKQFRDNRERKIILEIGAGWGGFAYQVKTLFPNLTYVIVDLPGSILFSATYLKTVFPDARTLLMTDIADFSLSDGVAQYDFIFIPHYLWPALNLRAPNLAVNMASFQEMTTAQVESYVKKLHSLRCPVIYSINRDHSKNNPELTTVSSILGRYYDLEEMRQPKPQGRPLIRERIKKIAKLILGRKESEASSIYKYRHLIGMLK